MQLLVDVDLLEHSQQEGKADAKNIPDGPHHGVEQDGADVLEERAAGHEVAGIQHDGGQEVEEENVAVHHWW